MNINEPKKGLVLVVLVTAFAFLSYTAIPVVRGRMPFDAASRGALLAALPVAVGGLIAVAAMREEREPLKRAMGWITLFFVGGSFAVFVYWTLTHS